jgi:hypothetical protein
MKTILLRILPITLLVWTLNCAQGMTLLELMKDAQLKIDFTLKISYDSISTALNFNYLKLEPMSCESGKDSGKYKLFYHEGRLVKLEFSSKNKKINKDYQAYFLDSDSVVYYILIPTLNKKDVHWYPHFGAIIKSDSLNLLFAFHNTIEPVIIDSKMSINLKGIYNYESCFLSIFILDKFLNPLWRCYFTYGQCVSFSLCKVYPDKCREYIHSMVMPLYPAPFREGSHLSDLKISTFGRFRIYDCAFSSYIVEHEFELKYCFNWEYYRTLIIHRRFNDHKPQ